MRAGVGVCTALALLAVPSAAVFAQSPAPKSLAASPVFLRESESEDPRDILWIFDADFEDLQGDNAGWLTEDWSGTVACENYWHKDTIRINGFTHLGDSTWWCGTYDDCWIQPRGYGNNWTCILSRAFPEVAEVANPGDVLTLEYDQRFAIEARYDYGYTDVSADSGNTWTTLQHVTNPGWPGTPGPGQDWDSAHPVYGGHQVLDLSELAGGPLALRFRFVSDSIYSSQDQWNNPPTNSCLDGAWQVDNIAWYVNEELVWLDDCESPGSSGWVTEDMPGADQTGVVYRRSFEEFDGHSGWMMAAYDSVSGAMVTEQHSWLFSPPIHVGGASEFLVQWDGWVDLPVGYVSDQVSMRLMGSDDLECVERHLPGFGYSVWSEREVQPPRWVTRTDTISGSAGSEWLGLAIMAMSWHQPEPHGVGIALDRIRVGLPDHTGSPDVSEGAWLSVACPSPFGRSATIHYGVQSRSRVSLHVYDLSGRLVRTLVDGPVVPGRHEAVWDGTSDAGDPVASGVYFVRMEAEAHGDRFTQSRKLVLLK